MLTGSGMPVNRILVSVCTENFEPSQLPNFLSNHYDFYIFLEYTFFPLKIESFFNVLLNFI